MGLGIGKALKRLAHNTGISDIGKNLFTGQGIEKLGQGGQDALDYLSGKKAMDFNAKEAQKQRDWEEMMSNTAHQREVADLEKAGLNPVLSATGGAGASTPSGASASAEPSAGAQIGAILGAITQIKNAHTTAKQVENQGELNQKTGLKILNDIKNDNTRTANDTAKTMQDIEESKARASKAIEETRIAQVRADRETLEYYRDKPILEKDREYFESNAGQFGREGELLYKQYGWVANLLFKAFGMTIGMKYLQAFKASGITKISSFQQLEKEMASITKSGIILRGGM